MLFVGAHAYDAGARLSLMTRFFVFLTIQGFLIISLSSGLIGSLPIIASNPGSIAGMLATNLPTASNFYLTYFATSGLGGAGGALLQIVTLILYHVFLFLLASTPRKVYTIKFDMEDDSWGTLFPSTTLFTVIGLAYTSIAPLLAGFAMLLFFLFYYIYKYLFIFVWDFPRESETGGLFFPLAVRECTQPGSSGRSSTDRTNTRKTTSLRAFILHKSVLLGFSF